MLHTPVVSPLRSRSPQQQAATLLVLAKIQEIPKECTHSTISYTISEDRYRYLLYRFSQLFAKSNHGHSSKNTEDSSSTHSRTHTNTHVKIVRYPLLHNFRSLWRITNTNFSRITVTNETKKHEIPRYSS